MMQAILKQPADDGLLYTAQLNVRDPELINNGQQAITWRHMSAVHKGTRQWLENNTDLDKSVIDNMVAEDTRPRILIKEDGVLMIFRAMNYNDPDHPEDMISLRMWVDCDNIYTTRCRDMKTIGDIVARINAGNGPQRAGEFLTMITNYLYARMEPFIDDLEDAVSLAEEKITNMEVDEVARKTAVVRRRNAIFRRYIIPQKNILETLINAPLNWVLPEDREQLVESHDKVLLYTEILNDIKDRSQILNEEIRNIHAEKLNSTTYIFSIAATIFLPLGFLTGLLGINVGGIPGSENGMAFWAFAGICATIVVVQVILFRRLRWF